jgi:hypothetical protein
MPLHPDLDQLGSDFAAIRTDAGRLTTGITDAQFNWRSASGQWSICECLAHLNVVDGLDVETLARAALDARADGWTSDGRFRYGALSSWFIKRTEPPVKLKMKAPAIYVPPPAQSLDVVLGEFNRIHTRLIEILPMANGLDLARIKVSTPIAKWIRFSFTQRMRLIAAHDRRHLWQAWQIPRQPGFPG